MNQTIIDVVETEDGVYMAVPDKERKKEDGCGCGGCGCLLFVLLIGIIIGICCTS